MLSSINSQAPHSHSAWLCQVFSHMWMRQEWGCLIPLAMTMMDLTQPWEWHSVAKPIRTKHTAPERPKPVSSSSCHSSANPAAQNTQRRAVTIMQCSHFGIFMTDILLLFIWLRHSTELFFKYIYLTKIKKRTTRACWTTCQHTSPSWPARAKGQPV